MQLFLRAQNTHTLEVTGQETVGEIKVKQEVSTAWPVHHFLKKTFLALAFVDDCNGVKCLFCFRLMLRVWRVSSLRTRCCCSMGAHWRMVPPWHPVEFQSTAPWKSLAGFSEVTAKLPANTKHKSHHNHLNPKMVMEKSLILINFAFQARFTAPWPVLEK